ncbi:hypothetical protein BMT54_08115 [Pasteurellaceae bacterium 15-036681]|nr:hypothetical protein BMT54_08115 [Pasteurellaceae bacterium 15-036681]
MQYFSLSLIAVSCALAISGCSSSRGGDVAMPSGYFSEKPVKEVVTPTTNDNEKEKTTLIPDPKSAPVQETSPLKESNFAINPDGDLTGKVINVNNDGSLTAANVVNYRDENINELVIGNTKIALFNAYDLTDGTGKGTLKELTDKDVREGVPTGNISGYIGGWGEEYYRTGFQSLRFGVYNVDKQSTLFVQGYMTPVGETMLVRSVTYYPVPASGTFTYRSGQALYGKDGDYQQLNPTVVANFDNKKLSVTLAEQATAKEKLAFSADIDGNTFSGKTNGIESKGAFFGSRADEVGGIFYQTEGTEKGYHGVFGANDKRNR